MYTRLPTPIPSAPPLPPSPITVTTIGNLQPRHLTQVQRDRLCLTALFGVDAGVGSGCVEECEDGPPELVGHFHQAQRFSIALGLRHSEVAMELRFGVATFLLSDDHDRCTVEKGKSAGHGRIIAKRAIPMQFRKVCEDPADVIECVGPFGMTRKLHSFP